MTGGKGTPRILSKLPYQIEKVEFDIRIYAVNMIKLKPHNMIGICYLLSSFTQRQVPAYDDRRDSGSQRPHRQLVEADRRIRRLGEAAAFHRRHGHHQDGQHEKVSEARSEKGDLYSTLG